VLHSLVLFLPEMVFRTSYNFQNKVHYSSRFWNGVDRWYCWPLSVEKLRTFQNASHGAHWRHWGGGGAVTLSQSESLRQYNTIRCSQEISITAFFLMKNRRRTSLKRSKRTKWDILRPSASTTHWDWSELYYETVSNKNLQHAHGQWHPWLSETWRPSCELR
jgi:hypothetical protein